MHRVTVEETVKDLLSGVAELDAPFWRTLCGLFRHPGRTLKAYLSGQRKRHYKPVSFFLVITLIYLLGRILLNFDGSALGFIKVSNPEAVPSIWYEGRAFLIQHLDKMLFVFIASLALAFKILFFTQYRLIEYIAISFYIVAIYTIFLTLEMAGIQIWGPGAQLFSYLAGAVYVVYAGLGIFTGNAVWVGLRALMAFFAGLLGYMVGSYFLAVFLVWISI